MSDKDNRLETSAREALGTAMWRTIQDVIEQAGIKEMVAVIVRDHIETDEFKESLKQRTIDAVKSTTFYVKGFPAEAEGPTT